MPSRKLPRLFAIGVLVAWSSSGCGGRVTARANDADPAFQPDAGGAASGGRPGTGGASSSAGSGGTSRESGGASGAPGSSGGSTPSPGSGGGDASTGDVVPSFDPSLPLPSTDCRTKGENQPCFSIAGTWSGRSVDVACSEVVQVGYVRHDPQPILGFLCKTPEGYLLNLQLFVAGPRVFGYVLDSTHPLVGDYGLVFGDDAPDGGGPEALFLINQQRTRFSLFGSVTQQDNGPGHTLVITGGLSVESLLYTSTCKPCPDAVALNGTFSFSVDTCESGETCPSGRTCVNFLCY